VGQEIAEIDDLAAFRYRGEQLGITDGNHIQGFADCDELTLYCRANQSRRTVAAFINCISGLLDGRCCLQDVVQVGTGSSCIDLLLARIDRLPADGVTHRVCHLQIVPRG